MSEPSTVTEAHATRFPLASVLSTAAAAAAFIAVFVAWNAGGGEIDLPWAPTLDLRLTARLDGLAALYALVASGVGIVVFAYAGTYLPRHLAHAGRSQRGNWRFFGLLVLFLVAMIGLATAQDLIALFVFWDLTAVASYFLIGFDRDRFDARRAALMALLITGASALLLLIGALMLYDRYGTFSLPEIIAVAEPGTHLTVAAGLIAIAALAKSAQVPLHFWLPRAMEAPTPVSAYLHSAAMVAAGVFLISRIHPLIVDSALLMDGLVVIGLASILVGGLLAVTADGFKRLLAYSTISQYGYVVVMLGLGTATSAVAACFYVVAHALAKAALFLTAGAVTDVTGEKQLSKVGGLWRTSPALAIGSGLAAAGLAALPLTIGFFKDELFFKAMLERGTLWAIIAAVAAATTLVYAARFWTGIFLGPAADERHRSLRFPVGFVAPIVLLGILVTIGGFWPAPVSAIAEDAGTAMLAPGSATAAYHLDLRAENLLALAAWSLGAALFFSHRFWAAGVERVTTAVGRFGPEEAYRVTIVALDKLSDGMHALEVRDLRARVAAILVPAAVLVAIGVIATPFEGAYVTGDLTTDDLPLAMALVITCLAAIACTVPRNHLMLVLILSALGFAMAVAYGFFGAPDVALVAVLVETVFLLLFLGVFALLPRDVLRREAQLHRPRKVVRRNTLIAALSGTFAFLVVWGALSRPALGPSIAEEHLRLAPEAHASDVVTAILADFRGLDTLVEITVILVAVVGLATLLRRGRLS